MNATMTDEQLDSAFMALADPTRRSLVARLALGDATVGELAAPYAMSLQAVSKHLTVLEQAHIISRRRDAQRRPCSLNREAIGPLIDWLDAFRRRTEDKFQRIDELLARDDLPKASPTDPHSPTTTKE